MADNKNLILADLKVGDELAIISSSPSGRQIVSRAKVERFTKTLVITKNVRGQEGRFRRADGWEPRSGAWSQPSRLASLEEQWVIEKLAEQRRENVLRAAEGAMADFRKASTQEHWADLKYAVDRLEGHWAEEWAKQE